MKNIILLIGIALILAGVFGALRIYFLATTNLIEPTEEVVITDQTQITATSTDEVSSKIPDLSIIAENLTIPWDIAFLPDGDLLVTERDGALVRIDVASGTTVSIPVTGVLHKGEGGLLGMAAHPNFTDNNYVYLYMTSSLGESSINTVTRYTFAENTLTERVAILENIPGSLYHNGGRIAFGPDGKLYVATGDARDESKAQDLSSLAGKILRMNEDGSVPSDNPFAGSLVYSYGHRNPQGLTWDEEGNLWSTEHGRSGVTSGLDELNLIVPRGNYGWPESQGDTVLEGTIAPVLHSGPDVTWAPASATHFDGSIFFAGLRGETLYEAVLDGTRVAELREHFKGRYGRLRTTVIGPEGALYLTTSNRDGRGEVREGDDKIIRLDPKQFR